MGAHTKKKNDGDDDTSDADKEFNITIFFDDIDSGVMEIFGGTVDDTYN